MRRIIKKMNQISIVKEKDLKQRWESFRAGNPHVKIREAAELLNTTEAELLATEIGATVVRLKDNFDALLQQFHKLKRVMALTRNDEIVHERKGEYGNVEVFKEHGKMGLVLGDDIDLRIFFDKWRFGFAVTTESARGALRSFQFFNAQGLAVHKVFLTDQSDASAYENLLEKYRRDDQNPKLEIAPKSKKTTETPDSEIDVENFQKAWSELKDTHDFFPLIRKFGVSREQALRLADREMAFPVSVENYQAVLKKAAEMEVPIMIFVGNDGIIQIHTGEVENIVATRGWFNVLDEKFNLHIKHDKIASAWIVRKPTVDGIVSSLELFNKRGENVALVFGKRKPGIAEDEKWRELLSEMLQISS